MCLSLLNARFSSLNPPFKSSLSRCYMLYRNVVQVSVIDGREKTEPQYTSASDDVSNPVFSGPDIEMYIPAISSVTKTHSHSVYSDLNGFDVATATMFIEVISAREPVCHAKIPLLSISESAMDKKL